MTEDKSFKRRVRARMSKTGESYTAARAQVAHKRDRERAARTRLAAPADRPSDDAVRDATGKSWDEWFALLDRWGARDRKHGEIARHLTDEHGVAGWWAQSVTVAYERARGMRLKHQQSDGFSVSVSKTVAVPVAALFDAFVDDDARVQWLADGKLTLRTARPHRSARFDWDDGTTRVNVGFVDKGPSKSTVSVAHERLPGAHDAETAKGAWRRRLDRLESFLASR